MNQHVLAGTDAATPLPAGRLRAAIGRAFADVLPRGEPLAEHESFFEAGGDSVLAVLALLAVEEETGRSLPVRLLFGSPRLGDFVAAAESYDPAADADLQDAAQEVREEARDAAREKASAEEAPAAEPGGAGTGRFPLSFPQRQLWFLDRLYPGDVSYNLPLLYRLRGPLDRARLRRACDALVARHAVLRTVYGEEAGVPYQEVRPAAPMPFEEHGPHPDDPQAWRREADALVARPFDLAAGPVVRAALFVLGPDEHVLALCIHHIAFDGWSAGILLRDLQALYAGDEAEPPAIGYGAYARQLTGHMTGRRLERLLGWWRDDLAGLGERNALFTDVPRRGGARGRAGRVRHEADPARLARLRAFANARSTTLFVVLHAALTLLLSRYTRQADVTVGTPMANRGRPDLLGVVGFFANSLVLRNPVDPQASVDAFVRRTAERVQAAFAHQELPFDLLVEALRPERRLGRNPLFDVMFVLQNTPRGAGTVGAAAVEVLPAENVAAKFDILLNAVLDEERLQLEFEYDSALFAHDGVACFAEQFDHVLDAFLDDPERALGTISTRSPAQARRIGAWNDTERALPFGSIPAAFAAAAARAPGRRAVVAGGRALTYGALARTTDALARDLAAAGCRPGDVVAVFLPRGIEAVAAMLAILKAGAAYLPLDPAYPAARVADMAQDAGLRFAFAAPGPAAEALGPDVAVLSGDPGDALVDEIGDGPGAAPADAGGSARVSGPRDPAYLMYTSGSTGRPKGVFIPQEGILRLVLDPGFCPLGPDTVMLQSTSISFDTSAFEIWGALLNGGTLVVHAGDFDAGAIADTMRREAVTTLWMTSGLLEVFAEATDTPLPDLRWLVAGGDVVPPKAVEALHRLNPDLVVVNGYGPTENSVLTCCHEIERGRDPDHPIPIGRPIANTVVHVLDAAGQPAGIGVPGELVAAGRAVGLGYHDRDALNAEKFPPDPERPGLRLYRTGDLVRWRPDGTVAFHGRIDSQLKIRGFRIEPAEIEAVLLRHPAVALGAVTVHGDTPATKFLVAWAKPSAGASLAEAEVGAWLRGQLPEAWQPAHLRVVETLPVTINGKVDRGALRAGFALRRADPAGAEAALEGPVAATLASIWTDLLGLEAPPAAGESFFDLGGTSLLAVRLLARLNAAFGIAAAVRLVFDAPLFADLARAVEAEMRGTGRRERSAVRLTAGPAAWIGFPGIGANAASLMDLAFRLARRDGVGVSVIDPVGLEAGERPAATMAELVEDAAAIVARAGPGPVRLFGHSFGGRVAFEVARHLEARGAQVELVLLDALPGDGLVPLRFEGVEDTDAAVARWIVAAVRGEEPDADPVAILRDSGVVAPERLRALLDLARAQFRINRAYVPSGRLRGPVHLLLADRSLIGAHPDEAIRADLASFCDAARLVRIASDHFGMVRDAAQTAAAFPAQVREV